MAAFLCLGVQAQNVMDVELSNGKVDTYDVSTVKSVSWREAPVVEEYVDLGLPSKTLWATRNIGAENPEDFGLYFMWGDTKGYTSDTSDGMVFDWSTYKYCKGSDTSFTKYCTISSKGFNSFKDDKTELDLADDAAYVNLGAEWRMPSQEQYDELLNGEYTKRERTTVNNVYGILITSKKNQKSIFFPAAGYRNGSDYKSGGSDAGYWSRTLRSDYTYNAWCFFFDSDFMSVLASRRNSGLSVRPVRR